MIILSLVIAGLATGSVYGLAAMGLVLTYRTSGIFNFAFGALATVSAYLFYFLHVQRNIDWPLVAIICVVPLGLVLGMAFERLTSALTRASLSYRITATVGVTLIVEAAFLLLYGSSPELYPNFLPDHEVNIRIAVFPANQAIIFGISLVAVLGFTAFIRKSELGIAMRAVVNDPDLLALTGVDPKRIRKLAWIIGCSFACLCGLLIAPSIDLNAEILTLLVVQAFGAAAIGLFRNLGWTFIGGLLIGIAASVISLYTTSNVIFDNLTASLPFIVLFLVFLVVPKRYLPREPAVRIRGQSNGSVNVRRIMITGVPVLGILVSVPAWSGIHLLAFTTAMPFVILFISLGLIMRYSGQVSLCHAGFAAIGAVAFSKVVYGGGVPWLPGLVIAGLITVPFGLLIAIPAIRHSGLYLALATFGFGMFLQSSFYNTNAMFGLNDVGLNEPIPHLSWLNISSPTGFYYLLLLITVVVGTVSVFLVSGRLGRILGAISQSNVAAKTLGVSVEITQITVFGISAFLAGIAGALYGASVGVASTTSFDPVSSLTYVALIVIAIGGEPFYALVAAFAFVVIPSYLTINNISEYMQILFGVFAVMATVTPMQSMRLPAAWLRWPIARLPLSFSKEPAGNAIDD